jgi:predicted GIY-YIG superfamily endonuclease
MTLRYHRLQDEQYYIYALKSPMWKKNPDGIFYVGVTLKTPARRLSDHLTWARNPAKVHPKYCFIREILTKGDKPEVITLEEGIKNRELAFQSEMKHIKRIGYDKLLNIQSYRDNEDEVQKEKLDMKQKQKPKEKGRPGDFRR